MDAKEPFPVNIADLDAVREEVPRVAKIVEDKREVVRQAQREFAYWSQVLERLRLLAGEPKSERKQARQETGRLSSVEAVVKVINDSAIELGTGEVYERLRNDFKRDTVTWALWKASQDGRIQHPGKGRYASLDYEPRQRALPKPASGGQAAGQENEADSPVSGPSASGERG